MSLFSYDEPTIGDRFLSNFLVLLALAIIVFSGFFILEQYGFVIYLLIVIITINLLIFWHSQTKAYKCKNCGHEFEIKFWTDLISAHSFKQKMLICPGCHLKDYATELVKKKIK